MDWEKIKRKGEEILFETYNGRKYNFILHSSVFNFVGVCENFEEGEIIEGLEKKTGVRVWYGDGRYKTKSEAEDFAVWMAEKFKKGDGENINKLSIEKAVDILRDSEAEYQDRKEIREGINWWKVEVNGYGEAEMLSYEAGYRGYKACKNDFGKWDLFGTADFGDGDRSEMRLLKNKSFDEIENFIVEDILNIEKVKLVSLTNSGYKKLERSGEKDKYFEKIMDYLTESFASEDGYSLFKVKFPWRQNARERGLLRFPKGEGGITAQLWLFDRDFNWVSARNFIECWDREKGKKQEEKKEKRRKLKI